MEKDLQVVGFRIGNETFGVRIASVREIVRVPEITAVPSAPETEPSFSTTKRYGLYASKFDFVRLHFWRLAYRHSFAGSSSRALFHK